MGKKRRSGKRKLSVLEDYDQDGVPNFDDCQPLDSTQQHALTPVIKVGGWVGQKAQQLGFSTGRILTGQAPLPHHPGGVYQDTTPGAEYGRRYTGGPPRRGTHRAAAPRIDPSVSAAQQRTTEKQHREFEKAQKWNIASIQGRVYFDRYGIKRIAPTKKIAESFLDVVSPLSAAGISVARRVTDIGADIGREVTTKLGQLGTDIQRQAPKKQRPVQETILFGGFIGKGERVGRLAVAPTPQRIGLQRIAVLPVVEAKRTGMPAIVTAPVSMLKKGVVVATTPFGLAPAVSGIHKKLTSMYEGIAPPPEQRLYKQRFHEMETGVTTFETKWQPYVKEERFAGSEAQYKQMLKEHTALEAQLPDFERMQQQMSGLQYKKVERKLADYKTGWIYTGTEKFLETMYPPYIRKAQEAVSSWQRDIGYKPSEHPWLKKIEHAQWYTAKELPGMMLRGGAMLPPALEAAIHKPQEREKMQAAVVPGLAFMGKGMVEEAQREPLGFMETLGITMLAPKAVARISPIKPMYMKVPTGKSLMKTYTTIGKGVPYEFKALKEVAGPFSAIELGKIAPTKMPGVYKQTHLIPEMATYRGLRLDLPSTIPYHGKTPLVGMVMRPSGKRPKMVTPEEYAKYLIGEGELGGVFTWRAPKLVREKMKTEGLSGYISHYDPVKWKAAYPQLIESGMTAAAAKKALKEIKITSAEHEIFISPEAYLGRLGLAKPIFLGLRRGMSPLEIMSKAKEIGYARPRQQILAHELYHYKYPKATEAQTIARELEFGMSPTKKMFALLDAPVKRHEFVWGTPEFEMPAQFRVFTGPEARLLMPSMKKMLKGDELAAWDAAFYLQETFGRKRPIIQKPLKIGELEHLKEAFGGTKGLQEFTRYMQKHHRQMSVYGSAAKQAQMARGELITPKDIDIEIRSLAAHLSGLTTEMKVPFRARLTPFEVEMAHKISRRIPGLTPEQVATDMAAIARKYLDPDIASTQMVTPEVYAKYLVQEGKLGGVFTFRKPATIAKMFEEQKGLHGLITGVKKTDVEKNLARLLDEQYTPLEILTELKTIKRTPAEKEIYIAPHTLTAHMKRQMQIIEGSMTSRGTPEQILKGLKVEEKFPTRQEVLAHELYHYKYPKATEAQVHEMTTRFALSETKELFEMPGPRVPRVDIPSQVQVSFKPAWQMFSVEKVLDTMQKTVFGMEPEVMGIADIHPPSGLFEFGLKPQRGIKVPVISGLPGEKMPLFPKRVKITTLGEEFERSFGSVIQMYERRGGVVLSPKPKRVKDIGRFVQTGKMLVETEQLRAELGSVLLRKGRLQKVAKGREALAIWEERALKVPELKEIMPSITAEAILPEMVPALKQQMRATSLILSERAVLGYSEMMSGRKLLDVPRTKQKIITEVPTKPKIGWDVEEFFGKEPLKTEPLYWASQHKKYRGMDVDIRLDTKHLDRLNAVLGERLVHVCSGHAHLIEWSNLSRNVPEIGFKFSGGKHLARRIEAMRSIPGMKVKGGKDFVTISGLKKGTPKWWEGTTTMIEQIASTKRFQRTPYKSIADVIRETKPITKDQLSYMMAEHIDTGPGYKTHIRDMEYPIEISKTIDTFAYYPKMPKHVPSDYYPKMVTPMVPSDYYPKMTPIIDSSYYSQKMPIATGYDYYPKPPIRAGDSSYYGTPTRKHISQRGAFTPFIGAFMPSFGVGIPKIVGMPKMVGMPKYTTYVSHIPVVTPTTAWTPPPTGFAPTPIYTPGYAPPPGPVVPPQIPPTPSYVPPYAPPPPTPVWTPPLITIWTPPPPPPTITRLFPLLPPKKKPHRHKKKYQYEELPWKEKHYIPTLQELMRVPKTMTMTPQKAFVMKMPKMPKSLF